MNDARMDRILVLLKQGETQKNIGLSEGLTKQRVSQILHHHYDSVLGRKVSHAVNQGLAVRYVRRQAKASRSCEICKKEYIAPVFGRARRTCSRKCLGALMRQSHTGYTEVDYHAMRQLRLQRYTWRAVAASFGMPDTLASGFMIMRRILYWEQHTFPKKQWLLGKGWHGDKRDPIKRQGLDTPSA